MVKYIKTFDSDLAEQLSALGFHYVKERVNNQDVYAFMPHLDLLSYIGEHYCANQFILDDKLRF